MQGVSSNCAVRIYLWSGIAEFWEKQNEQPWVKSHPVQCEADKSLFIPWSLHGDDVACWEQGDSGELVALSWTSDLSRAPTLDSRMLITVVPYANICEETLEDINLIIKESSTLLFKKSFSTHCLSKGTKHGKKTWRGKRAAKPLSEHGFRGAYSGFRGDLVFNQQVYGFLYHRLNELCKDCFANKVVPELSPTDFRKDARWWKTECTNADYMHNASCTSKLVGIPGWHVSSVWHDTMHGQNLGTGQRLAGCALHYLCKCGWFGGGPQKNNYGGHGRNSNCGSKLIASLEAHLCLHKLDHTATASRNLLARRRSARFGGYEFTFKLARDIRKSCKIGIGVSKPKVFCFDQKGR